MTDATDTAASAAFRPLAPPGGAAWRALHEAVVVAPLPRVGGLRVTGPDRLDFLHGQLAHDVRGLAVGGSRRSLLLDEKGHARAEATVHRRADDVHLAVEDDALHWVHARLRAHIVFDQVELEALPDRLATLTLQGPRVAELLTSLGWPAPDGGACVTVPFADAALLLSPRARSGPGGVDVHLLRHQIARVVDLLRDAGAVATDAATLEPSRLAAGLPRAGSEGGPGVLPQEAGLVELISYRKGCYLGQEVMARIEARGRLKRGLVGLRLAGEGLATLSAMDPTARDGDDRRVLLDGRKVGVLGGVAAHPELGAIALAVLRHDVDDDQEATLAAAAGVTARRMALPFVSEGVITGRP